MKMFFVYAIMSESNSRIYIGQTNDVYKRLMYHNRGYVPSTEKDRPWSLLSIEEFNTREEARWRERGLKKSRGKRTRWIQTHYI